MIVAASCVAWFRCMSRCPLKTAPTPHLVLDGSKELPTTIIRQPLRQGVDHKPQQTVPQRDGCTATAFVGQHSLAQA